MTPQEKFILYIQFEKRLSPHTVRAYQNDLNQFFSYLSSEYQLHELNAIDHQMIRSWLVTLMEEGISNRSINRKLTTLKRFFRFLLKEGLTDFNPMNKVVAPKTGRRLPVFVPEDGMTLLLDKTAFPDHYQGMLAKVIIELFYGTGIRLAELINLKDADVDLASCTIKVTGKRNKERIVPLGNHVRILLNDYKVRKDKCITPVQGEDQYFFLTERGHKLYARMVYRIVNYYLKLAATIEKKSPHVLRHTFATHMLNRGADLNAIKEILGHASLSATQVYTHNTIEKLKKIYQKAHPKA